jgi:hypothetical protein
MHVMAISSVPNSASFWNSLKAAHGQLPRGANWVIAIASTDGTKAVNVVVHESLGEIRSIFEEHIGDDATTDYVEADAANAVGLPAG